MTLGEALQQTIHKFRLHHIEDAPIEARVLLVFVEKSGDQYNRKYFELKLERNSVYFFPLTWTIVHPIDEDSPFYGKTETEIKLFESEILILIKGFDDTFSQVVHSRYSYTSDEIIWNYLRIE